MFTIDASVQVNALIRSEPGSADSLVFLEELSLRRLSVFSPTLLQIEAAATLARNLGNNFAALALARALQKRPGWIWIPLNRSISNRAIDLALAHRLRGADAVYAAVAQRYGTTLITMDAQQLQRLPPALPVQTPAQALAVLLGT